MLHTHDEDGSARLEGKKSVSGLSTEGLKSTRKITVSSKDSKDYGFERVLQSQPHLDVGSIQRNVLINQGVSAETYESHLRAWVFFFQAFELPADVRRFQRSTSPGGF